MKSIRTIKKINIIIALVFVISIIFSNYSLAVGSVFSDADAFLGNGAPISTAIDEGQLKDTSNFLYKLLLSIGIVAMFIVGTIIGIQFMVASAEDKAKVKEALVPYIIGCAVIFGAFTIWSIAVNIGQDVAPTPAPTGGTQNVTSTTNSTGGTYNVLPSNGGR